MIFLWYHHYMRNSEETKQNQMISIAEDVLRAAKDRIVANMRFMDSAIFALREKCDANREGVFGTDGATLYYSPDYVISMGRDGISEMMHAYMHLLLHCMFRHYKNPPENRQLWDIAADMAAEALIQSFEMDSFRHCREEEQREALTQVRRETEGLSAERIYRWLASENRKSEEVQRLGDLFRVDDHGLWYPANSSFLKPEDVQDSEESKDENPTELQWETDVPDWDRIAQMVKISLETENRGAERGELLSALNARTEKHMDYSTFLRKFTLFRENLKVDDSAFDYIFYTYGLELYGDMPLVEPLEYADERTISDFVIVIDTSASTQGKLVERFVQRTFDLLQESREIKNRFNIHLIQCDAAVQEDRILRTREDVHRYLENMELKGLGGTDYRPAFHYINNLVERGEFRHLQGVLYFTDGKGIFPRRKPPYDTAFIFEDDAAASEAKVPSWGMKVVFGGKDEY